MGVITVSRPMRPMPFVAALKETGLLTDKDDRVHMFRALTAKDKDDLKAAMRAEGIEVIPAP